VQLLSPGGIARSRISNP